MEKNDDKNDSPITVTVVTNIAHSGPRITIKTATIELPPGSRIVKEDYLPQIRLEKFKDFIR